MKRFLHLATLCALLSGLVVSCTPEEKKLDPPSKLEFSELSSTSATLSWTAPTGADKYKLKLGDALEVEVEGTTYRASGLQSDTDYKWSVQAVNASQTSAWIPGPVFRTLKPADLPAAPTSLTVGERTSTTAELSWKAAEGVDRYNVMVGDSESIEVNATSYTAAALTPETTYKWKVQSVEGALASQWVDGPEFKTEKSKPTETDPPTGLTATEITHESAILSWQHPNADSHEVMIGESAAVPVEGLSYKAVGLTRDTPYTWKVRSIKNGVPSGWVESEFKTNDLDRVKLIDATPLNYFGDMCKDETHNWTLEFTEWAPKAKDEDINGIRLFLSLIVGNKDINTEPTTQIIELPQGRYNFVDGNNIGSKTIFMYDSSVGVYVKGKSTTHDISGGTMTIFGTPDNYTIKFDITYDAGELHAIYTGPLKIKNPFRVLDLGTMTGFGQFQYIADGFGNGTVDVWKITAFQTPGIYIENGEYKGNGWLCTMQIHTPMEEDETESKSDSTPNIPEGEYTIDATKKEYTVLKGNPIYKGLRVRRYENGESVEFEWLKEGVVTVEGANGQYKISVDAIDLDSTSVQLVIERAAPASSKRKTDSKR